MLRAVSVLLDFLPSSACWPFQPPGVDQAATWLERLGCVPGTRLGLAGLNRPATAQVLLAGLERELELVLLNRRLTSPELEAQLAHADLTAVLAHPDHPASGLRPTAALPDDFLDHHSATGWDTGIPRPGPSAAAGPDGGLILFTSGTEGTPKAAVLPRAALFASATAAVQVLGLTPADTWGCPLPLDHIGGVQCLLRAALSGCRVRLAPDPDGCSGISVVPTQLIRLMEGRSAWPPGLRRILVGGGPLDPAVAARCAALGLPPSQTYGLTEMGSMVTVLDPADWQTHPDSAGRPVPGTQVRIAADGRIEVAGTMRFHGYLGQSPAAAWFTTNDLGGLTADGHLIVRGRLADLIVTGGENVYPAEVEAVLRQHPAVADCGVCGLPDAAWGQVVAAVVVLQAPCTSEDLEAFATARLAGFKRPRRWRFVSELPRNGLGKLQRLRLGEGWR